MKTQELENRQLELIDELEKHFLSLWRMKKMNCIGCHPTPVIATHKVRQEGYHIGVNDKVITDVWNEYFCDECYQEYRENL